MQLSLHAPPILLYHKIATTPHEHDPLKLDVPPARFAAQMRFLHDGGYRCLSLADLWELQASGQRPPRKAFAITFDDAYLECYTEAFPILQQYGFTATIFTITDFVGRTLNWPSNAASSFLDWSQIAEMRAAGIDFGGHTHTHADMAVIDSAETRHQITRCKQILDDKLGQDTSFFAYPYGRHSAEAQRIVAEVGFRAACGVDIDARSRWNLWRVQLNTDDGERLFQLKLSGWFETLKRIRQQSALTHWITDRVGSGLNRISRQVAT